MVRTATLSLMSVAFAISLPLTGALADSSQQKRMRTNLEHWIGSSVAEYAAEQGSPQEIIKISDTESSFRWVTTASSASAVIPLNGSFVITPPRSISCTVILRATTSTPLPELRDFTIRETRWFGQC
jgi:hypothetical protein